MVQGIIDSSIVDSDVKIPVPKGLNVTFDPPTAPKIKNRARGSTWIWDSVSDRSRAGALPKKGGARFPAALRLRQGTGSINL